MSNEKQNIRKRVEKLKNIPTMPGIFEKITPLIDSSDTAAEDIAHIISSDQVLSAKVLRVVNSVFYGFPGRISSLTHALIILGFDVVKGLMLSTSVFDMMLAKGLHGLWEHSLGCAVTAGVIARKTNHPNPEEVSIAALLHDIGKLIIRIELPEESSRIDQRTSEKPILSYEAEEEILGLNHAKVGKWLCKEWHLPEQLSNPIAYHHKPSLSKSYQKSTAIVHTADVLVRGFGFGFPGDTIVPQIDQTAWELLNISDSLLEEIIKDMDEKLEDADDFLSDSGIRT